MALTVTVTPGKKWASTNDPIDPAGLNQTANPTVLVEGGLSQLTGVVLTSPVSGQALVWNGTNWINGSVGAAYVGTFAGATASAAGSKGGVPAPAGGDQAKFLRADSSWAVPPGGDTGGKFYKNVTFY